MLESAPNRLAALLAQYLNLIEGYARKQGVPDSKTEVAGHEDSGDGARRLLVTHRVGLPPEDLPAYRSYLGRALEEWIRGLPAADLDLVQQWLVVEVRAGLRDAEEQ